MESQIEINDALITKWEPKVQKIASSAFVLDMDRDDIAQELRIAIIKAAKAFNKTHGAIFHTYLHTTMDNTVRTLMSKVKKRKDEMYAVPLEITNQDNSSTKEVIDMVSIMIGLFQMNKQEIM